MCLFYSFKERLRRFPHFPVFPTYLPVFWHNIPLKNSDDFNNWPRISILVIRVENPDFSCRASFENIYYFFRLKKFFTFLRSLSFGMVGHFQMLLPLLQEVEKYLVVQKYSNYIPSTNNVYNVTYCPNKVNISIKESSNSKQQVKLYNCHYKSQ